MTKIATILRESVDRQGVIPFSEFMRLALYCPKYGYYEQGPDRIGYKGDFYTSVSLGSLFGELLAFQCAQWLEELPDDHLQILEAGAHNGQLAADVLAWFRDKRPAVLARLEYWIIEPSSNRRKWQRQTLEYFADCVRWFESLDSVAEPGVKGVILSNELLDAMPVRRVGWDARKSEWFEWGVGLAPEQSGGVAESQRLFVWKKMPLDSGQVTDDLRGVGIELSPEVLAVMPDEYTIEVCPKAGAWWRQAAGVLSQGKILTIDYGCEAKELIRPERTNGTLRAYHQHQVSSDLLARPGEQDLTAHINFTQLRKAGEEAGLVTESFLSQERFFSQLAAKAMRKDSGFGDWTPARARQFQTLTHPEHLGRPFSVLVQRKHAHR